MRVALKLMMAVLALVVCILGVEARLRVSREAELFEADMRRNQHVLGTALRSATELIWRSEGPARAQEVLAASEKGEVEIGVRLVELHHGSAYPQPALDLPEEARLRLRHGEEVVQMAAANPRSLYTYVPLDLTDHPTLALELSTSMREEAELLREGMSRFAAWAAGIALVTSVLAMFLGNWVVGRPVRALVTQARRVGGGDFVHHSTIAQRDELGQLGRELDTMADNLAEAKRRLEEEIRGRISATEQLRHADRLAAVGTLAAGIAHELGTPLHVVSGRAKLTVKNAEDDRLRRNAEIILEQCERMERIVRELLTFARVSPADRHRREVFDVLERSVSLVEPLLDSRRVELVLPHREEASIPVEVAEEQIEQVLTNLFINAIHAMPDGGRVMVSVEHGQPPSGTVDDAGREYVCMAVEDEGTGIAEDDLDRIFDPFFTTKEVGQGVGLGLSVAHGIVRDHGGVLLARNRRGVGARFEIWLPEAA